jgi:subtilase family serine protease
VIIVVLTTSDAVVGLNDGNVCERRRTAECYEGNLDIQYILSVAQNAPTTFWNIDDYSINAFVEWLVELADDPSPPLVHSISYNAPETESPVERFNIEIKKLALRGVTVVVASGDNGVGGSTLSALFRTLSESFVQVY